VIAKRSRAVKTLISARAKIWNPTARLIAIANVSGANNKTVRNSGFKMAGRPSRPAIT